MAMSTCLNKYIEMITPSMSIAEGPYLFLDLGLEEWSAIARALLPWCTDHSCNSLQGPLQEMLWFTKSIIYPLFFKDTIWPKVLGGLPLHTHAPNFVGTV